MKKHCVSKILLSIREIFLYEVICLLRGALLVHSCLLEHINVQRLSFFSQFLQLAHSQRKYPAKQSEFSRCQKLVH